MNYYELFELPAAPAIDHTLVAKKYFFLQKKYHPDFFIRSGDDEQEDILQLSADINKAYHIFRDRDRSLEYYLQQKGIVQADEKYDLPPDFLMEMMELNEAITEEAPEEAAMKVASFGETLSNEVTDLLKKVADTEPDESDLKQLKSYHYRKKYLNRILDRLGV